MNLVEQREGIEADRLGMFATGRYASMLNGSVPYFFKRGYQGTVAA